MSYPSQSGDSIMNEETVNRDCANVALFKGGTIRRKTSVVAAYPRLCLAPGAAVYHTLLQNVRSSGVAILVYFYH